MPDEGHRHDTEHHHLTPLEEKNGPLPELRAGDIVLIRHRRKIMRWFLRQVTNSYWDHSALVIFPKDPGKGYHSHIIVEAIQHGIVSGWRRGTEVHKLEKYLNKPKKYDIGIKRYSMLDEKMQHRIRSFLLMNVDSPYYHLWTFKFAIAWFLPPYRRFLQKRQRYSCSSLIQKAYYESAPWEKKESVMFREKGDSPIELQELITPGDLAESDRTDWVWNAH